MSSNQFDTMEECSQDTTEDTKIPPYPKGIGSVRHYIEQKKPDNKSFREWVTEFKQKQQELSEDQRLTDFHDTPEYKQWVEEYHELDKKVRKEKEEWEKKYPEANAARLKKLQEEKDKKKNKSIKRLHNSNLGHGLNKILVTYNNECTTALDDYQQEILNRTATLKRSLKCAFEKMVDELDNKNKD